MRVNPDTHGACKGLGITDIGGQGCGQGCGEVRSVRSMRRGPVTPYQGLP